MAKIKKSIEDRFFPIATIPELNQSVKPAENRNVTKKIIQGAIQGAFHQKTPSEYDLKYGKLPKTLVSTEQIELVTHMIESLQPADAIEAALASQFAITHIRGLEKAQGDNPRDEKSMLSFFAFGHRALETLQRYRTKGAQLINIQYNHNQGQINSININKKDDLQTDIEV